ADLVTGQMVLDLVTPADAPPQIVGQVWEDPTHMLLVTTQNARWTVLRLAVDGTLELATDVVTGADTTQFDLGRPLPNTP
ncbi:MAG TPA: hypothetical protein PKA99_15275, partial [Dermatophilaceae bacterium]|nr:hypothetical protein [Dermatophilaceae bacterium]